MIRTRRRLARFLALAILSTTGLSACGSSPSTPGATSGHGPVNVLYAGSLTAAMESKIGPAFHQATGYAFSGFAGGSVALANQIRAGLRQADVFVSASPKVNAALMGSAGNQLSWYASFARSPLVIGYDTHSRFAADLASKPWYQVMTEAGFRLGRTDPKLDPKGRQTVALVDAAGTHYGIPDLAGQVLGTAGSTSQVFPEEELVGRLQAGQLDAGFFYSTETTAAHIPTIAIDPAIDPDATYTVATLNRPTHRAGADAFVEFLLGPAGRSLLAAAGLKIMAPVVSGDAGAVPRNITVLHP